jgi:hypothetical protein
MLTYGLLLMSAVLFLPTGIAGGISTLRQRWRSP